MGMWGAFCGGHFNGDGIFPLDGIAGARGVFCIGKPDDGIAGHTVKRISDAAIACGYDSPCFLSQRDVACRHNDLQ